MHILLAEDDERLAYLIEHMLKKERHTVDVVHNGEDAYDYALCSSYDLLILDWMMPKLSGLDVCQKLRKEHYEQPILMLTAKDAVDDRVLGLDAGADDYLVKPFEFKELFARIRALSRRSQTTMQQDIITVENLTLNRTSHTVERDGVEIYLTPREYQLLELLMINAGQVVPREVIYERIWGFDGEVSNNTIDAFVRLLRKKIDKRHQKKLIHNVRGLGYKLEA